MTEKKSRSSEDKDFIPSYKRSTFRSSMALHRPATADISKEMLWPVSVTVAFV